MNPSIQLTMKGNMKYYIEIAPTMGMFGRVVESSTTPLERTIKVTNKTEKPIEISMPPSLADKKFKYELKTIKAGQEWDLVIKLEPPFPKETLNEVINLTSNVEKQKTIEIRSNAQIAPRLELQPSLLDIGAVQPDQPFVGSIFVINNGDKPVKALEVKADAPEIKLTLNEVTPTKSFSVKVEIPAGYKPPEAGNKITIKTDDTEKPLLEVPVKAVQRPRPQVSANQFVGKPAPVFAFKTMADKEVSNATLAKGITLLNFTAGDCPHCKKQMPKMEALRKTYEEKGVRFVNVVQKMKKEFSPDEIKGVFRSLGAKPEDMEIAFDMPNIQGGKFGVSSYPTLVVLGKTGNVEAVDFGNPDDLEGRVKNQLDTLLAGKALTASSPAKPVPFAPLEPQAKPAPAEGQAKQPPATPGKG